MGASDKLTFLLINLFVGVSTGASIAVSQSFGRGDLEELRRTIHSAICLGLISGAILMAAGQILAPKLLVLMGTPADVLPMSTAYIKIYFLGMIPVMIYNMGSGILRAMGNSRSALIYLAFAGVINVGLDLLFVRGLGWGVPGAAAATAISQILPAVLVFLKLTRLEPSYRLTVRGIRLYKKETIYVVQVGVPAGLRMVLVNISNVIVQSQVNAFGGLAAMAGCTLFFKLEGYLYAMMLSSESCSDQLQRPEHGSRQLCARKTGKTDQYVDRIGNHGIHESGPLYFCGALLPDLYHGHGCHCLRSTSAQASASIIYHIFLE